MYRGDNQNGVFEIAVKEISHLPTLPASWGLKIGILPRNVFYKIISKLTLNGWQGRFESSRWQKSTIVDAKKVFFIWFFGKRETRDVLRHGKYKIGSLNVLSFLGATNCNPTLWKFMSIVTSPLLPSIKFLGVVVNFYMLQSFLGIARFNFPPFDTQWSTIHNLPFPCGDRSIL